MSTELTVFQNGQNQVDAANLNIFEQICPDVSTLRSFVGTPGMQVYLQGTMTINDGGQGPFYWNASGTGPDDGGTTNVVPNGSTVGCWTRLTFSSSLSSIANNRVLANISGVTAAPIANTLSAVIDSSIGNTQGNILYRNASGWVVLAPGAAGQLLSTGGAAANPSWVTASGTGTVTSVSTNNGLTGGTITASGTIGLASVNNLLLLANISGGNAPPSGNTLTGIIDAAVGNAQGSLLYRGASTWVVLAPGTAGQLLQTQGASANPQWATAAVTLPLAVTGTLSGASTTFTVDFTTYSAYKIYILNPSSGSGNTYGLEVSIDGGANYVTGAFNKKSFTANNVYAITAGTAVSHGEFILAANIIYDLVQPVSNTLAFGSGSTTPTVLLNATLYTQSTHSPGGPINRIKFSTDAGTFSGGTVILQPVSAR